MKANEAPEKIYLIRNISTPTSLNSTNDCHEKYLQEWYKGREKDTDVEYTRTDAFIEKACDWLETHINDYIVIGWNIDYMFDDFRKAMEASLGTNGIKKI